MTQGIATLGIAVDTSGVKRAVSDLDALGQSATRNAGKTKDINSAFKQFNDGLFAHERAAKAAAEAEARLKLEQQALGQVATSLTAGQIHFIDALKEQAAQAGKTGAELLRLKAAQLGMAAEAAPFIAQIEGASGSVRKFSIHTAEARESLTSLIRSAATGDVTQFGSSLTTLAGRAGVLRMVMSGTGLAVMGVSAAVAGGLFALYQMEEKAQELANALTLTNNAAGLTAESFQRMVEAMGAASNLGDARAALLALVATGRMSAEAMDSVGRAAITMSRLTGQSAEEVAKEYAKMADGVVKFVDDHEKSQNLLTTSQYQHIRALEEEGRAQEAMTAYGKYVDDALAKNTESLGTLHQFLRKAKDGWKDFWAKAMDWKPNSTQGQIDSIIEDIKRVNSGRTSMTLDQIKVWGEKQTTELQRLYQIQRDDAAKAAEAEANATAQREGKEAVRQIDAINRRYEGKKAAEERAIKEYKDAIAKMMAGGGDFVPSDDEQAAIIAKIRKAYAETDNAARALSATQINAAAQRREVEMKADADTYATRRALGELDQIQFDRNMSQLALRGNLSRQMTEQQMLGLRDLSAAERAAHQAKLQQLKDEFVLEEQRAANRERVTSKAAFDASAKAVVDDGYAKTGALDAAIQKQREYNAEIGLSAERVRQLAAARFAADTQAMQSDADFIRRAIDENKYTGETLAIYQMRLSMMDAEIAKRNTLAGLKQVSDDKASGDERAARMTQQLQEAAQSARAFGEAMGQAFGSAGQAVGGLVRAMTTYAVTQDRVERERKLAVAGTKDQAKIEEINAKAAEKSARAQIDQYGDMARAAKGFFKEGSKGYAGLEAAEKTFRAVELAMSIESHLTKSGLLAAFTSLFVSAKATETAATVASVAPDVAASMAKGAAAAAAGVANQAQGDPYSAWVRMAAMATTMAAIGFAVDGVGGKPTVAADRQSAAGTGSTFGDMGVRQNGTMKYKDKSDSIAKSLELVSKNTDMALGYSDAMLRALRAIESSIGGLTNLAIRGGSLSKTDGIQTGSRPTGGMAANLAGGGLAIGGGVLGGALGSALGGFGASATLIGGVFGPLGMAIGAAIGYLISKTIKTKREITDHGLNIDRQTYGSALGGVTGNTYADVYTKKSFLGMTYSKDNETVDTGALGAEMSHQFTQVVARLGDGIKSAMNVLGLGGDAFTERLKTFVINIGEISTKDLSGEEIEAQFEAIFSKLADDMALFSIDGLQQFQKVGEGYYETLVRIANNFQVVDAVLGSVGKTFGAIGTDSLILREQFIELAGGLDELANKTTSFARNYLTEEERLAPVRKHVADELARLGQSSITTRDEFKKLVLAQDMTTVAGREMYLALLNLEQAFADTHAAAEDLTRSAKDIADERRGLQDDIDQLTMTRAQLRAKERASLAQENRALFDVLSARRDVLDAYERESQALNTTIDRLKQLGTTLSSFLTGLDQGNLSALTPMEKMEEARRAYEETLAKAKAGDATAQGQVTQAASNYLSADRVVNASSPAYTADFERVKADLRDLMATAGVQLSEAEKQLASMKTLTGSLVNLDESTVSLTDAIKNLHTALAQPGAGQIEGLYQSVLGRQPDAAGLEFWNNAYNSGTPLADISSALQSSPEKKIADLYQSILGRAPDQAGLQFWMNQAQGGMSMDQIAAAFKQSGEYLDGSHASGLARVPFDGYTAELHAGEAVIDAPAMAALTRYFGAGAGSGQGDNTQALVAEIRALREEVAQLRREQERQTGEIVHGNLAASERNADKVAQGAVEAARAAAWAQQQANKTMVK